MGFPEAPLDRRLPESDSLGTGVENACSEPSLFAGDTGEGMEENSVPDGDGFPQPNRAAKGEVAPGDFGNGLLSC